MAHQAFAGLLVVCRNAVLLHPGKNAVQNLLVLLHAEITVPVFHDLMRSSRIKSRNQLSISILPDRKLGFVSIAERIFHPHDRLHRDLRHAADALEISGDFLLLKAKLLRIVEHLQLASAARTCNRADRLDTVCGRLDQAHQARVAVIFLCFDHFYLGKIADDGVLDKEGIALAFAYTLSVVSHIFNFHRQYIIFLIAHEKSPVLQMLDSRNRL